MKRLVHSATFFVFTFSLFTLSHAQPEEDVGGDPIAESEAAETVEIPARPPPWTGRVDFGYTWQSGRAEKNDLSVRGQADRKIKPNEYRAVAEFLYGELDQVRNTQRFTSSFRWRRDQRKRVFTQTLTRYESDRIREVRNRVEQNVGVGYRFAQNDRFEGTVVPGFTIRYTDERGLTDRWDYLASFSEDFTWRINAAYRFEQELNFLMDPANSDDYTFRFNAGLVGTVTKSINMSIRYHHLYENQVRPGVERTDQRVIASVGYSF